MGFTRIFQLTGTVRISEGDDGSRILGLARLVGTVTDAITEVLVCAVAADVAGSTAELVLRNLDHVVDACLLHE